MEAVNSAAKAPVGFACICRGRIHFERRASEARGSNDWGCPVATVTKKQLTDRIADATKNKRTVVKETVQRFLDEIINELAKGNRLEFRDFGVFEVRRRKQRIAQNPRTLERVTVPPKVTVKFKVGRLMRERMQRGSVARTESAAERRVQAARPDARPPG